MLNLTTICYTCNHGIWIICWKMFHVQIFFVGKEGYQCGLWDHNLTLCVILVKLFTLLIHILRLPLCQILSILGHMFVTTMQILLFVTKLRIVSCDTWTTSAFSCLCNYSRVPTNIVIVNAITFCACGINWMRIG